MKKNEEMFMRALQKKYGHTAVEMAKQHFVFFYGREKLEDPFAMAELKAAYGRNCQGKVAIISPNQFNAAIDAAVAMVNFSKDNHVLVRLLVPTDMSVPSCPVCNGELEYDADSFDCASCHAGDHIRRKWTCLDCGASGVEESSIHLDQYSQVVDENGEEVEDYDA